MLSKFFKKSASTPVHPASAAKDAAAQAAARESDKAADKELWAGKLQGCLGDDGALLALAREAPLVDIKQAAVLALAGEDALKSAEREFRSGNQRVHRVAKQRYQAVVTQRESREQASRLIESAAILVHESTVPANRLVELDQAWKALDSGLLDERQCAEYARLSAQLSGQLRERGEQRLALSRWSEKAQATLAHLKATCAAVEAGEDSQAGLAVAMEAAQAARSERPAAMTGVVDAGAGLDSALHETLQEAAEITARRAAEAELRQSAPAPESTPASTEAEAKPAKKAKPAKVPAPELPGLVDAAESALAGGHLADTRTHLVAIEAALGNGAKTPLQGRIDALQAEYARLRGWQHWGGGRVRDDLVDEAEALARAVGEADGTPVAKLPIKQHAEAIEQLRERWKELDRLGAAGGKALWQRFDTALKAAYVPVAAQQAKLKAARQENLAARQQLIAGLDAMSVGDAQSSEAPDWRELARALEQFESDWRKLGPVEHTVPHKARDALLGRRATSVARLEAPLQEARRTAQAEREKFVARAKALAADPRVRDAVAKVRELQSEWQQHAKALPLSRGVENALWTEFRAATDALFKQRDAEHSARETEWKAGQATREALIARLVELNADTAPAEIERTIAAVDREWRSAGEAPRSEAGRLEEKFRQARAAASQLVVQRKQRAWQVTCDALLAKLALCESAENPVEAEAEAEAVPSAADSEARWSAQPALPTAWEQALHDRFQASLATPASKEVPPANESFNACLLQIEAALEIASPAAFQAARRDLKLRAMKDALEGRQPAGANRVDVEKLVASALGQRASDPVQRQRLRSVVEALRAAPPVAARERG
jgi:DNA repair protein SbcC/Rad50